MLDRRQALATLAALAVRQPQPQRLATFQAEVTPPPGHPCMGGGIAPVAKIDDPLDAIGFVLLGVGKPIVYVAVDWCEIRNDAYDRWRDVIAEAVGTERVRVLVSALHQHDAPIADLTAEKLLRDHKAKGSICDPVFHEKAVRRVAKAARDSLANARRVTHVGTGEAKVESVASNRRYLDAMGRVRFDRMSATRDKAIRERDGGTIDPMLKTLSLWDGETPLLALHAYATHPMSTYGKGVVSADFVGMARRRMQVDHKNIVQMYVSGCSGNVTAGKFNDGSPGNRAVLAERLHAAMTGAWKATKRQAMTPSLRSASIDLEARSGKGFSDAELIDRLKNDPRPFGQCLAALGLSWRRRVQSGQRVDLPVIDFGPAQLAVLPAEAYVEFQLLAQRVRPAAFTVIAGYGECGPGYIPIERAWQEGDSNLGDWCWVKEGSEGRMTGAINRALDN